ncbi:DUF4334 domain-containing protein [uncultured Jatrophihabitans sp.]|uniref:DUF4334 domain-containing protein n=1 Tax=uncultured Jatrophihabitans sp. TaxID=1610747 RepID=UPI0035C9D5B7
MSVVEQDLGSTDGLSGSPLHRLRELQREASTESALTFFDSLPPVTVEEMLGSWKGSELRTGHELDGLLEAYGWHGKRYDSADEAHPLVFEGKNGLFSGNPLFAPMGLLARHGQKFLKAPIRRAGRPLVRLGTTGKPKARLRMIEYRGVVSGTMSYDALPINDHFRRVDDTTMLGVMDLRGMAQPYFFVLELESDSATTT